MCRLCDGGVPSLDSHVKGVASINMSHDNGSPRQTRSSAADSSIAVSTRGGNRSWKKVCSGGATTMWQSRGTDSSWSQ